MSRLENEDSNRYEAESEQASRESSGQDDDPAYEFPEVPVASTSTQTLSATGNETASDTSGFSKWQTVIWREWSRCEDESYAYYLFNLIKNTTFGWKFVITASILGTIIGALMGYAIGAVMASGGLYLGPWNLTALPPIILGLLMAATGGLIGVEGSRRFRSLYFWWQGQPSASLVQKSLQEAVIHQPGAKQIWAEPLERLKQTKQQPVKLEDLVKKLDSSNWKDRFVAQKRLVTIGGEATQLLQELAKDEKNRCTRWGYGCLVASSKKRPTNLPGVPNIQFVRIV